MNRTLASMLFLLGCLVGMALTTLTLGLGGATALDQFHGRQLQCAKHLEQIDSRLSQMQLHLEIQQDQRRRQQMENDWPLPRPNNSSR